MMGQLLNLNCAILLSPVTHSAITKAHDLTSINAPATLATRLIRFLSAQRSSSLELIQHQSVFKR